MIHSATVRAQSESFLVIGRPGRHPYHPSITLASRSTERAIAWIDPDLRMSRTNNSLQDSAMKHGHISRNSAKAFFAFVMIGLVSACASDKVSAPVSEVSAAASAPAAYNKIK